MEFHPKKIRETLFVNLLSNSLNAQDPTTTNLYK